MCKQIIKEKKPIAGVPAAKPVSTTDTRDSSPADVSAALSAAISAITGFYYTMWYYLVSGGSFKDCPYFKDDRNIRCQLYSLTLILHLWSKPHYRNGTFQDDMIKNLRNVAVPGTGIPLSLLCYSKVICCLCILFLYPLVALVSAFNVGGTNVEKVCLAFCEQLLAPQDWFSFWRMNCRLASLHALVTGETGYKFEDKWSFLTVGEERGVPVSPWLKTKGLFVKHRNEEGGLGCASYANAVAGGDWIIQECLENADSIKHLLPDNAPLSTLRVISSSRGGIKSAEHGAADQVKCLSCVFRAGRAGAMTDHESILFDVDTTTGVIKKGTTNAHWYELGLHKVATCPWTSTHHVTHHPDSGAAVTGQTLPDIDGSGNMDGILRLVENAHNKLAPGVPLIGWDVAITTKGVFLLEGNFSCNFFRGYFDQDLYFRFVEDYFLDLEAQSAAKKTM